MIPAVPGTAEDVVDTASAGAAEDDAHDATAPAEDVTALWRRARQLARALHEPGVRDAHRALLGRLITRARALAAADLDAARILVQALAVRAEDARYGAGQLSRGAQRAPTVADCEDGWARVAEIVATAESAAQEALQLAARLGDAASGRAARAAEDAARRAREVVEARNHAYTFHADPGFSFGEGWYLAAAATLARVPVQIEPDRAQTAQVIRFVTDAGLAPLLQPYRPRPRANKPLTDIVARAFAPDPAAAQARVRAAFLGGGPLAAPVAAWADGGLARADAPPDRPKVLLWVRYARHHPDRNTDHAELLELAALTRAEGAIPVLVGDALRDGPPPAGAVDWTLFWKQPLFQGEDMRRAQLHLFEHLMAAHRLVGQIGVTTAGMDGPALIGLPTMYLTAAPNPRMGAWVGAVPGYAEVVRGPDHVEHLRATLRRWVRGG